LLVGVLSWWPARFMLKSLGAGIVDFNDSFFRQLLGGWLDGDGSAADIEAIADRGQVYRGIWVQRLPEFSLSNVSTGRCLGLTRPCTEPRVIEGLESRMDLHTSLHLQKPMRQYWRESGKNSVESAKQVGEAIFLGGPGRPRMFLLRTAVFIGEFARFSGDVPGSYSILRLRAITVTSPRSCHLRM